MSPQPHQRFRRDGWTPARQLAFLDMLGRTRSVTKAARAAGMSRESAYRLRSRDGAALFAAAWDRALASPRPLRSKGHNPVTLSPWRQAVRNGGFAAMSAKGHEMDEPLFSIIGASGSRPSQTKTAARLPGRRLRLLSLN